MKRRNYLFASAAVVSLAGCVGNESLPADYVPDEAVHHWAFGERDDETIVDYVGDSRAEATDGLENVEGTWRDGYAEYSPEGEEEHIDLGHLDTIDSAASHRSLSVLATINPTIIEPNRGMTMLGAGGGESNWFEFRLSGSEGARNGQPILFIRDNIGNTLYAAADEAVEVETNSRVAVTLDGDSAADVRFWINGRQVDTVMVVDDGLVTDVHPAQTYGIFASNPGGTSSIRTRRWFSGTIDNVVFCDDAIGNSAVQDDFETQDWNNGGGDDTSWIPSI